MLDSLSLRGAIIALLIVFSQLGCTPASEPNTVPVNVPVELTYAGSALGCPAIFEHNQQRWQIDRFALFVADVAVKGAESEQWTDVALIANDWQTEEVALLWFATDCVAKGATPVANNRLSFATSQAALNSATALKLTLAVPFALNHGNPLLQPQPLNIPEMFWSWRMGYKFMRMDLRSAQADANAPWSFHLGSVGCVSEAVVRPPQEACAQPNRFTVEIELTQPLTELKFDLAALLLAVQPERIGHCMLQPEMQKGCEQLLANLQQEQLIRQ